MDKDLIIKIRKEAAKALKTSNSRKNDDGKENGEDPGFNGATFLYIRAYDGDNGARPVPEGYTYWLSPDIEIYQNGALVDTAYPLQPGKEYTIRVTVRNDGDMDCSSCITDLFITHPSIGFGINNKTRIGLKSGFIPAHSCTDYDFTFITVEEMCGHKCLFARAYSLSSNDFPEEWDNFFSKYDRHIGQQNINIVSEGETVDFNIVTDRKFVGKALDIKINKHKKNFTKDKTINRKFSIKTTIKVPFEAFEIKKLVATDNLRNNKLEAMKQSAIRRLNNKVWREPLNEGTNKMTIKIPEMGLKEGEAFPFEVTVNNPETGEVIGGITWLVIK